uniref:CSON011185 protein n=1 Tax=Culicoides sonorensis TaxID=179676 RepID=A0A336K0W5_CULSO
MDSIIKFDDISLSQVAIYAVLSFVIVTLLGALIYITCSKKYKLNWFEKNLLDQAKEREELRQSREALVESGTPFSVDPVAGSSRSLNRHNGSPSSIDDPTFWVPPTLHKQSSMLGDLQSSADESMPQTPSSPTSSNRSLPLSTHSVPIARTDKHVVLTNTSPARPKVASMQAKLDHTKIDMSLYKAPKESPSKVMPVPEETKGSVHLMITYDPSAGLLTVRLMEAQNLHPREFSGTADPYAKIRLLPDKSTVYQTKIHKKTLNPVFDEDFVFEVRSTTITRRSLEILMYDFDAYSRHVCIGGLTIALSQVELSDRVELWKQLASCPDQNQKIELGDLMVSLSYLPSAERLTVVIIKARNLRVVDDTRNSSDPFVKVSLVHNNKRLKKKKTTVFRNTVNPVFNEAFSFDVSKDMLKTSLIEFLVLHDSLLGTNELLGRAVIGNKSDIRQEERIFFDEMLRTKTAIAQWIPLTDPRAEQQKSAVK